MRTLITIFVLTVNIFAFTPDDIKSMRDFGILVAFNDMDKPTKISRDMNPQRFLDVTYLNFNHSAIYNLPEWITKLTKLKGLDLNGAKINLSELKKITSLKKLTVLNLDNNNLFDGVSNSTELMTILKNFSLNELSLSNTGGNLCNYVGIGNLDSLIELKLAHDNLSDINDKNCHFRDLKLDKLNGLEVLDLSSSKFSGDFETQFLPLNSLVDLNLAINNIQNFKYYKPFPKLERLNLSKNSNLKIAPNYGGLFAMKKLLSLPRESNIKVPDGLKNRLNQAKKLQKKQIEEEKRIAHEQKIKKEEEAYKNLLKRLGIEKTHGYLKDNDINFKEIPIGSMLYVKKRIVLKKENKSFKTYGDDELCGIHYNSNYKKHNFLINNFILEKGTLMEISEVTNDEYYRSGGLFDDTYAYEWGEIILKKSPLTNIYCSNDSSTSGGPRWTIERLKTYTNEYFDIFIKK